MTIEKEKNSLRNRMATMAVGDRFMVGASYKGITVRNYASILNAETGATIRVHFDRTSKQYEVTRTA